MMPGRLLMPPTGCKGLSLESSIGDFFHFVTHLFSGNVDCQPTAGVSIRRAPVGWSTLRATTQLGHFYRSG
jgi:hypothetical protein